MNRKPRTYSGSRSGAVTDREIKNRKIARAIAAEGIVLLKNEGLLPVRPGQKTALYGSGIQKMIKGGTGSGDVNEREVVTLVQGMKNAGVCMINEQEAAAAAPRYEEARNAWIRSLLDEMEKNPGGSDMAFLDIMRKNPFIAPAGVPIVEEEVKAADVVIYMISRVAGEGRDRFNEENDYYLSAQEKEDLDQLAEYTDKIAVLINAGSQIDVEYFRTRPQVKAVLFVGQGGMEMGNSVADVLTGKVTPSGKLTDTWAVHYEDFPNSATFSHNNGDVWKEKYEEGIYIGYRYFDSFGVDVAYPFGYGLSYTDFAIQTDALSVTDREIALTVTVTNTGSEFSGKEVVEVYASCPQEGMKKEFKRLIGFGKTGLLAPQASQTMTITMPAKTLASFSEEKSAWIVEKGQYGILVGASSAAVAPAGILEVAEEAVIEEVPHICPLQDALEEIVRPDAVIEALRAEMFAAAEEAGIVPIAFAPAKEIVIRQPQNPLNEKACEIASQMTDEELAHIMVGEVTKGQDNIVENQLVQTGIYVPGAAGETSMILEEKYDVPAISMADGPAGLRLMRNYDVDRASGLIYGSGLLAAIVGGCVREYDRPDADRYYQYATAIPVGSLLASSWDVSLLEEIGKVVGTEMHEFGVSWWLAPGMNIHRNPLCGRNFEYYSEDPLVAGVIAAAITRGVQSLPGVGTTIKHFACNNQEDNRTGSDSIVSERALREIYLKGFEIAVKTGQPMCIMTSYNLINGIHTAANPYLNTECARKEWGFEGIIMTDWGTTNPGNKIPSVSHMVGMSGNDLIMPGEPYDIEDYMACLASGEMPRELAQACAQRMVRMLLQTLGMKECLPYAEQFELKPYVTCR